MARDLLIVLRTCTTVNSASGTDRYIKVSKHNLVNICVSSLINSINQVTEHTIKLVVLDDHSTTEAINDVKQIISHCKFPTEFISINDGTGNGWSMKKVYEQVEQLATDLWYHIEDDYLHVPEAIQEMIDSVDQFEGNTGQMVAINPHDDIWRYTKQIYDSIILLGPSRHYRTVKHTTYTCLASRVLYNKYKQVFQNLVNLTINKEGWVEDQSINQIWNQPDVMLFSPIPGLAFHIMDESGKDPYIDVIKLFDNVPKLWLTEHSSKVAIVSIFSENQQNLADLTWTNKQAYAKKHGYTAFAKTSNFSKEQIHFDKFVHILDIMKNTDVDWIWWIDNDAMITNFDIKIEDLVDHDYHIIIGTDIAALNTGSFIVKNSLQAQNWLEYLLSKKSEYKNDKKWFEQQAVIDFYPKFQELFKIIPQKWLNSYDYRMYNVEGIDLLGQNGQWEYGDFVIHWPGLPNETRVNLAQQKQQYIKDTL